ncbi:hypothetical protein HYALB_00008046 [Hymenoscyphus albidus]|uniref:LITAF domain-containing protein n=1 Tax=Hymenoscyphus albidus TaxID=595503 RepID=A0A9N9Q799_9HELO|nr:hypothetical protein HYALB_00008046 [Hymenoscyphus albidus]
MPYQDAATQGDIALQPIATRSAPAHRSQKTSLHHTETRNNHMGLDGAQSSSEDDRQTDHPMQMALIPKGPRQSRNPKGYPYATPLRNLKDDAAPIDCTFCGAREATSPRLIETNTRHLAAGFFCFLPLCLFCIPYFSSWFKDMEHRCGSCGAVVAIYHRTGRTEVMHSIDDQVQEQELEEELAQLEQEGQSFL